MVSGVRMFGWKSEITQSCIYLSFLSAPPLIYIPLSFLAPFPHYLFPFCLLAPSLPSSCSHHLGHYSGSSNHYHLRHWLLLCHPTQVPQKQVSFNCCSCWTNFVLLKAESKTWAYIPGIKYYLPEPNPYSLNLWKISHCFSASGFACSLSNGWQYYNLLFNFTTQKKWGEDDEGRWYGNVCVGGLKAIG